MEVTLEKSSLQEAISNIVMFMKLIINGLTVRTPWANFILRGIDCVLRWVVRKKKRPLPTNPKKILIANIANLGDVVIATTAIPALQRQFPNAELGFLVASWAKDVALARPSIRHVHTLDHCWRGVSFLNYLRSARKARKEIRALNYDIALDLHPYFPNAIPLLHRCKIPFILGYSTGGFSALLTHSYTWSDVEGYMGQMHLNLLNRFGINTYGLPPIPSYLTNSQRLKNYAVVHMGTSRREKEWKIEKWIELIRQLPLPVLLTGKGAKEKAACEEVAQATGARNLADVLSWDQFATTVQFAKLLITVDSSAVHLAAASQTPTVVIFSGVNSSKLWAPHSCRVVMQQVPCAPCFNKSGCPAMTCIREVSVPQVLHEISVVLNRFSQAGAYIGQS